MKNYKLNENLSIFLKNILDIDFNHDFVFIKDNNFRYIYANNIFCNLFNLKPNEIYGKTNKDFTDNTLLLNSSHKSDLYTLKHNYSVRDEFALNKTFRVLKVKINLGNNSFGILCFAKENKRG